MFTTITLITLLLAAFGARIGLPARSITALYVVAYGAGGLLGTIEGVGALRRGEFNVDLLMILAALGAAFIGQPTEGAILLFLFSLSNTLQEYALGRNRQAIEKLLELRPPIALVKEGADWVERPVEALRLEDIVLVRPGERFPIDGEVVSGETEVDQSPITGESVPVPKRPGDPVFAGTVNTTGAVEVRVTHLAQDTTLAKIVQLVEKAQEAKARTQRMLDDFEQVYAKLVLLGAVLLVVVPVLGFHTPFDRTFYRAMTWLVVASPCALVISTPASILSAIANGARHGVLFKGGAYLEQTALIKVVAFDKTGTLTEGEPKVTGLYPYDDVREDAFLRQVAAVEARSEHPIARAIVHEAQQRGLEVPAAEDFRALVGQGVEGWVDGHLLWIGNERLFAERDVVLPTALRERLHQLEEQGQTAMLAYDATAQTWLGVVAVADTIRADAPQVVVRLKKLGIERVVMLTGDNERVAQAIARQVDVDEAYARLLPKDKVTVLESLRRRYGPTAMVGDGVNDAPALATADVGIAMGGAGTDVALETADVVLMADNLSHLPYAIGLARRARRVVWQNLTFSLAVIVLLVALAFGADLPLPLGVVGHEGSTVLVVLNGLRLLAYRG
ncbi:MAG TPA: cadmium-translocating P-type ATPase [Anaerolineae bacterium]|nr:cadmium-translocating P-type ATPase [Anaerolineae bacterium]HID85729.1 cadmium-translocating P-type ATPase [Anaerolineales bacterium]HIQ08101.1 cadmium-translocating P-type ATPase [Anaerolineaceae bacterium]